MDSPTNTVLEAQSKQLIVNAFRAKLNLAHNIGRYMIYPGGIPVVPVGWLDMDDIQMFGKLTALYHLDTGMPIDDLRFLGYYVLNLVSVDKTFKPEPKGAVIV